jgi:hypothetical protein
MDLDAYRVSAESFMSELTGAFYRHYAGLDEDFAIEPVYAAHAELFTRGAVESLRSLTAAAPEAASSSGGCGCCWTSRSRA